MNFRHCFRAAVGLCILNGLMVFLAAGQDKGPAGVVSQGARSAERTQRWAVLIGVNNYEDEQGIGSLKYCVADMKLLYEVLTGPRGGFQRENVLLMTDDAAERMHRPTYSNMVTMIPRWLEDVGPEDDVLIAFSGHGMAEDDRCYLLPGDAKRGALRLTSVSVPQVREWLEGCRAQRKVLILDACHSGAGKAPGQMSEEMKEELEQGRGFLRLASCDTKQKSSEDPKLGHGVFTYSLVAALRGKGDLDGDGRVGADEAYRYVSKEVRRWARERGLHQDPLMSGRLVGGQLTLCYAPPRAPQKPATVASPDLVDLMLRLDPPDTQVLIDGERMPVRERGRVAFMRMTPGRHVVEAMKDGYARVEKVIDVPTGGAEGTVRLAQMVTHVTVYMRSGRKREGELLSRSGDKITLKMGKGKITLSAGHYERLEEREVAEGESSVEVFAKGSESVGAAIGQGLISPLPEGTSEEQVKVFRKRWDVNQQSLEKAQEVFRDKSPEVRRLERQKEALSVQAQALAQQIRADAAREELLRENLLVQGQAEGSPVMTAANVQIHRKLLPLGSLACCLTPRMLDELCVVWLRDSFDDGRISSALWRPCEDKAFYSESGGQLHLRRANRGLKSVGGCSYVTIRTPPFVCAGSVEAGVDIICPLSSQQYSVYLQIARRRIAPQRYFAVGVRPGRREWFCHVADEHGCRSEQLPAEVRGDEAVHRIALTYEPNTCTAVGSVNGRRLGEMNVDFTGGPVSFELQIQLWRKGIAWNVSFDNFTSNVVVPFRK